MSSLSEFDSGPHSAILSGMHFRIAPHMFVIGWLAILACVWTTGDRVIDLVFEELDVVADTQATTDEPDNAAEHVLMPSPRGDSSASGLCDGRTRISRQLLLL